MELRSPLASVIPGAAGEVLLVLARASHELTGNVIASLTDGKASQTGANKALKKLVASGLVLARPAGNAILYSLNRDHLAAGPVLELADLRSVLLARIKAHVAGWKVQPVSVVLFGSMARGQGTASSDNDLLVIRPTNVDVEDELWVRQVTELSDAVQRWSGNVCEILEYSNDEFTALVLTGDTLVDNLRNDAVGLVGRSPRELTRTNS